MRSFTHLSTQKNRTMAQIFVVNVYSLDGNQWRTPAPRGFNPTRVSLRSVYGDFVSAGSRCYGIVREGPDGLETGGLGVSEWYTVETVAQLQTLANA